jgi:hypothetical protein
VSGCIRIGLVDLGFFCVGLREPACFVVFYCYPIRIYLSIYAYYYLLMFEEQMSLWYELEHLESCPTFR